MASIDEFKSLVNKRGGFAKGNRFVVAFTPPTQSLITLNPGNLVGDLLTGQRFRAKSLISDPRDIGLLCDTVSMPGRSINTLDFQAEKQTLKIPNGATDDDVEMSFLLTNDYYMKEMFERWMSSIVDIENYQLGYKADYQCDIVIQQLNDDDKQSYGIKLINAYPIAIGAVAFDNSAEGSIQKLPITFAYDNYVTENSLDSSISKIKASIPNFLNLPDKFSSGVKSFNKIRSLF